MRSSRYIPSFKRFGAVVIVVALVVLLGNTASQLNTKSTWGGSALVSLVGPELALADGSGNADVIANQGCVADLGPSGCTSNDTGIASVSNITILDDGCQSPTDTVTFSATYTLQSTAAERYDIGLYFATDGDPNNNGALTGTCTIATPAYAPSPWLNLDGDQCGDLNSQTTLSPIVEVTALCTDDDGDGLLNLPNCTTWDNNSNTFCSIPDGKLPIAGTPAKCSCDPGFQVPVPVGGEIIVDKIVVDENNIPIADDTDFSFTITGPDSNSTPDTFSLSANDEPRKAAYDPNKNPAGPPYAVSETVTQGYQLVNTVCIDKGGTQVSPTAIYVDYGDTVTCTFTNKVVPTSTSIALFNATGSESSIDVMWATVSEETTDYFNLFRSTSPDELGSQINAEPIAAQNAGLPEGATYEFADADVVSGVQYFYTLEIWDIDGTFEYVGPVMGVLENPTAITMDTLNANRNGLPLAALMAAGLLAMAGMAWHRRRKA